MAKQRAIVYVDGFNLYYGCLKGTTHKWLNLQALCDLYLDADNYDITFINYFTARISATPDDPDKPLRQDAYLRALKTLPKVKITYGMFISEKLWLGKADGSGPVEVLRMKEKRSDVNLASFMLMNAFENLYDAAVLISGDSDFITPVSYVKECFKKSIVILDPTGGTPNSPLNRLANSYKPIRGGALEASQFSLNLQDANGHFSKPGDWFGDSGRRTIHTD